MRPAYNPDAVQVRTPEGNIVAEITFHNNEKSTVTFWDASLVRPSSRLVEVILGETEDAWFELVCLKRQLDDLVRSTKEYRKDYSRQFGEGGC